MRVTQLSIIFLLSLQGVAQEHIGHYFNADGRPLDGYFDEHEQVFENRLSKTFTPEFEKGVIYGADGNRKVAYINFTKGTLMAKNSLTGGYAQQYSPKDYPSFTVGTDSFFVVKNLARHGGALIGVVRGVYLKHICSIGSTQFAQFFDPNTGNGFYFLRLDGGPWIEFPSNDQQFYEFAKQYFGREDFIKWKIENRTINAKNSLTLIKMTDYHQRYINKKPIYLDHNRFETKVVNNALFRAEIVAIEDSIWTMKYFMNNILYSEINYKTFFPHIKEGKSFWYDGNGVVRKEINYKNDSPVEVKTYYNNGKMHYQYLPSRSKIKDQYFYYDLYMKVYDKSGKLLLNENGEGLEEFYDSINKRTIYREYDKNKLIKSYYYEGTSKVYQFIEQNKTFRLKPLQRKLTSYKLKEDLIFKVGDDYQGTVLISVTFVKKGYPYSYEIVHSVHPEITDFIEGFLDYYFFDKGKTNMSYSDFIIDGEKQNFEILIPLDIEIMRPYRLPRKYYYHELFPNLPLINDPATIRLPRGY